MATNEIRVQQLGERAAEWRDARETLGVKRERLQDSVIEAIDVDGMSTGEVARAIGLSRTRVYEIIGAGYKK